MIEERRFQEEIEEEVFADRSTLHGGVRAARRKASIKKARHRKNLDKSIPLSVKLKDGTVAQKQVFTSLHRYSKNGIQTDPRKTQSKPAVVERHQAKWDSEIADYYTEGMNPIGV